MASPLLTTQPFKGAYFALFFCLLPPRLFSLAILYLLRRSLRPVQEWSIVQRLGRAYLNSWFNLVSVTHHQAGEQLVVPKNATSKFITLEPPTDDYFSRLLRPENIKPSTYRDGIRKQKVVLHFPGGAFVLPLATNQLGEPSPSDQPARRRYTRFLAAIQDLVTAYHHLIESGVDLKRIIISGDSAGGNLALALLRGQDRLPLPSGFMAFSPPVHFTAHADRDYEGYRNGTTDILAPSLIKWAVDAYLLKQSDAYEEEARPFFSPLHHPFKTKVPLFLHVGKKEAFYDTIKDFSTEMSQIRGNQVRLHETELAPHDIFLTHKLLGFTHQIGEAMKDARRFFEAYS
ncbi:Alpha/Beta hydrolase protein [Xylaria venustula]|nr:Alpha/Beta hydrolase protein [Xylaria venustula]